VIFVTASIEGITHSENGTICDGGNVQLLVFGVHEFQSWFNHLDTFAVGPIHRKLLYAATDSLEVLGYFGLVKPGLFNRMKKFTLLVQEQWKKFGWGVYFPREKLIQASVQNELTVGFALALAEFFEGKRLKFESNQLTDQTLQLSFQPSGKPMTPVSKIHSFDWDFELEPPVLVDTVFEVDKRSTGWYLEEHRSFLLPRETMAHFFYGLLPVEFQTKHRKNELLEVQGVQDQQIHVIRSVLLASSIAEQESKEPSFIQTQHDWSNILNQTISNRGFGSFQILNFDFQLRCVSIMIISGNIPYIVGKVWSKWDKATGSSSKCVLIVEKSGILVHFSPP
jgi:hypothetical protein